MTTALAIVIVTRYLLFGIRSYASIMSIEPTLRDDHHCRLLQETGDRRAHRGGEVAHIDAEIVGALLGAVVGAFAGAAVSRWSIRYDRRISACSAMEALADEARFNAQVVRHLREDAPDYSPSATERQAFDAALPVLHVLPPALRDRSRDARSKILIMMHMDEILEMYLDKSDAPPAAVVQKRQALIESLPTELESLADSIETFIKTDCQSRWLRARSASRS